MEVRVKAMADLRAFMLASGTLPGKASFDRYAATLIHHHPSIDALVYVDSHLIIRHIYPSSDDNPALGVDLNTRPSAPVVRKAVTARHMMVDAPHTIIGGQEGFLVRAPLYSGKRFLGLVQGVFLVRSIVHQDLGNLLDRYAIRLSDHTGHPFWGAGTPLPPHSKTVMVKFAGTTWILAMGRKVPDLEPSRFVLSLIWGGGIFLVIMLMYAVHRTWTHKRTLDRILARRTAQLRSRNAELEEEIAQRRGTEERLRRSEERLKEAQAIGRVGSWEWDIAQDRIAWSDELYRVFGVAPGAFEPTYERYLERIHPDDRERMKRAVAAALNENSLYENNYRILCRDGTVRHIHGRGQVIFDADGQPVRMAGIAHDVTEQRLAELALQESERKYRAVMESASDGILIADLEGRILDGNRHMQESLGYTRAELLSLSVRDIHPPEGAERVAAAFRTLRREGVSLFEHAVVRKDRSTFPAEVAGTLIRLNGEEVALGIFRDITARKRIEEVQREHRTELERLVNERTAELLAVNRELESFSYSVSHDLRAPLRAINGFSQALQEEYGGRFDETAADYIDRIRSATERMNRLIEDLLTLSRTMRGELQRRPVDLSALAEEVAQECRLSVPQRSVRFDIAPKLRAECDPTLVRSLLENLIGNAWKYTGERAQTVIEVGAVMEQGQQVFFVRDNGIGFDMRHAHQLFEPFQRLHSQRDYDGSGIGLATVARIARRHGGRVWAEGEPGVGATFYFTLGSD